MPSFVQTLAKETQITFSKERTDKSFSRSLNKLIKSVSKVQASDLNLIPDAVWNDSVGINRSPVICIPVFVNENFSMDAFVIKDGARLLLHDHPGMHGIIKVIHGTLEITAYNPIPEPPKEPEVNADDIVKRLESLSLEKDALIPVELHESNQLTCKSEPSLLTPTVGNYHEISAVNGTAAMFDILAPPYGSGRRCNLYSLIETEGADSTRKMWLSELSDLKNHWVDLGDYNGPKISI